MTQHGPAEMTTPTSIASEYSMQPYELAAFLDLGRGAHYEKELDEEEAQNIADLLGYD